MPPMRSRPRSVMRTSERSAALSKPQDVREAMIGFLRGTLIAKRPPSLTLDVGGVGYELEAPMSTFYRLPDAGQTLSLVTHLVVREDAHILFGFFTEAERSLFRSLLKVSNRSEEHTSELQSQSNLVCRLLL